MSVTARPRRRSHCATSLAHEQLVYLHNHGCDQVQGYLFSRPVAAPEFEALDQEWPGDRDAGTAPLGAVQATNSHTGKRVGQPMKLAAEAAPTAWVSRYTAPTIATTKYEPSDACIVGCHHWA